MAPYPGEAKKQEKKKQIKCPPCIRDKNLCTWRVFCVIENFQAAEFTAAVISPSTAAAKEESIWIFQFIPSFTSSMVISLETVF